MLELTRQQDMDATVITLTAEGTTSVGISKAGMAEQDALFEGHRSISRVSGFFFQAEDGIRGLTVTGVQTCALPISASVVGLGVAAPVDLPASVVGVGLVGAACDVSPGRVEVVEAALRSALARPASVVAVEIGRASCRERV